MKKKLFIFVGIIIVIMIFNHHYGWSDYLSDTRNIAFLKEMVNTNRPLAAFIYTIITIISCTVLALPGATFAIFAGLIFGPIFGIIFCLIATTIGASIAFLVGRFFLKDAIKPMIKKNKYLNKLLFDGAGKSDLILLMITRMVPLFPYNLQNFAYGITDIGFFKYTIYTFIFMIPGVSFITIASAGLTAEANKWVYFLISGLIFITVFIIGFFIQQKHIENN